MTLEYKRDAFAIVGVLFETIWNPCKNRRAEAVSLVPVAHILPRGNCKSVEIL